MKKTWLLLPLITLLTLSCSSGGSSSGSAPSSIFPSEPEDSPCVIDFETVVFTDENGDYFNIKRKTAYDDSYFSNSGKIFNKDLALATFANYVSSVSKKKTETFFMSLGFDNIVHSPDFDVPETKDSVNYHFAHKTLGAYDLISISMSGTYDLPWISNVNIGKSGNAVGFQSGADKVLDAFKDYLKFYPNKNYKIWLTGYSRSAAIANIIAETLLDEEKPIINDDKMFCYTFETPAVVDVNLKKDHPSIHNIFSSEDLVAHLYPTCYGLVRAGHDIDISIKNIDAVAKEYDNRLVMTPFCPMPNFAKPNDFLNYVVDNLTHKTTYKPGDEKYVPDMSSRDNYVDNNYQQYLNDLLEIMFNLKEETIQDIMEKVSNIGEGISSLMEKDGIYNFLSVIMDAHDEIYDKDNFRNGLDGIMSGIKGNSSKLLFLVVFPEIRGNFIRAIENHALEILLPALLLYGEEAK